VIAVTGRVCHRRLVLQPGELLLVNPADWADTLVVVLSGDLELTCHSGRRTTFAAGAVLTLDGMPVRTLHNPGPGRLTLHLVHRHR
jgi:hypothetical protein